MLSSPLSRFAVIAAAVASVRASQCVVFDASWNLYALNVGGADYNLGTSDNWSSGKATPLTTTGRPPFTGTNTQCFLSQFENAFYILDADAANPTDVYIFDASAGSWTNQKTTAGGADPTSFVAILDHDTNVFFALSAGVLYQADFGQLKAANSTPIEWQSVENPGFSTSNYSPVMALANNHIHFLDVPGASAGEAYLFVIHFAFFQPAPQTYTAVSGSTTFPEAHGLTTSFFLDDDWQEQFAFIPDDGSATYVVNVQTNTTVSLAGPSNKGSGSTYAASTDSLVQLTSGGTLSYLAYDQTKPDTSVTWKTISVSGISAGGGSSSSSAASGSPTSTGGGSKTSGSSKITTSTVGGSGTGTSTTSTASATQSTGAASRTTSAGLGSVVLAALALFFA